MWFIGPVALACNEAAHLGKREAGERRGLGSLDLLKVLSHPQDLLPLLPLMLPQVHSGDQVFNTQPLGGLTQTTEAVRKT